MSTRSLPTLRLLAPLAVMAAIFFFSSQPFDGDPLQWWEVLMRKLGHLTGYALLTTAWAWALSGWARRPVLLAALFAFLYSCTDEYHQTFVDGRSGSPVDVLIDSAGIALASLALASLSRRRTAKTKPGQDAGRPAKRAHLERA
ncbi:MAG: VanZ family protein [Actinomycetota bacterium]|nr:VanZ family protein [Actinomycetota bacterium]